MTEWRGCYDDSWRGTITDEAFSHPAKFAKGLIERIADYVIQHGGGMCVVSSPPFGAGDSASAQSMTKRTDKSANWVKRNCGSAATQGYGTTPGQLGAMPPGSPPPVNRELVKTANGFVWGESLAERQPLTVVDPFGGVGLGGIVFASRGVRWVGCELEPKFVALANQNFGLHRRTWKQFGDPLPVIVQGDSRRLRESLTVTGVDAVVSSPPYEGSTGNPVANGTDILNGYGSGDISQRGKGRETAMYGDTEGQLGHTTGDTFWTAAADIVRECHAILKPGGLAVWVCKDFVRKGERVPFSDDWRRLCERQGFELVEWIKASLVKVDSHPSLFGGDVVKTTERKSFFRRLAEAKGSPEINEEDVIVMVKGASE